MRTTLWAGIAFLSLTALNALAQWAPATSGTTQDLRGVYLLDSGAGYVVGGAGTILKSSDAGVTWSALSSGTTQDLYDVAFLNDSTGVAVGDGGVIVRTTDGGATWAAVSSGVRDGLRSVSFNGANGICGGLSQDILYSSDSGATWRVSQKGFFGGGFFGAQMISPTVGFVTGQNSIFQGLEGTTVDGGVHWSFHTFYFNGNEGSADDVFFFDDLTGVTSGVLFDGTGAIARTANGGTDWSSTLFPQGMQGIDFPKPESGFAVGFFGTILHSTDLGLTWSAQESGIFSDLFEVNFASDALTGVAVGSGGTILRTDDGGQAGGNEPELVAAASHMGHFDIDLPLTGSQGIECRQGGLQPSFTVVFTFNNEIASVEGAATTCGMVRSSTVNRDDAHQVLVTLTAACNEQNITVTLTGVHDGSGGVLASADVTMGLLLGDVTGDGVVNSSDVREAKRDRNARTDANNFRVDINTNGRIDNDDFAIVKTQVGTMLPP